MKRGRCSATSSALSNANLVLGLGDCVWVRNGANILITGPCGTGKSWIACAFAHKACLEGYLLDLPEARRARERDLTVDVRTMKAELRKGLSVLPTPMVSARASLHGHHTARLRGEEVEQLAPAQLPAERNQPVCLRPMQPKAALREVDPDDGNLPHGCLLPQVVVVSHEVV